MVRGMNINVGAFVVDAETGLERRPTSKAEVRRVLAADPSKVRFDVTVAPLLRKANEFPDEFRGETLLEKLDGRTLTLVGPDPHGTRGFYGTVTVKDTRKKGLHVDVA